MPANSYAQTNFLGGQWSGFMQGRQDDPRYKTALAVCRNAMPGEEGSWLRRSGFLYRAITRHGETAVLRAWRYSNVQAYLGEFSDLNLRFWSDGDLQFDSVVAINGISTDNPAELDVGAMPEEWLDGDDVVVEFSDIESTAYAPELAGRFFTLVRIDDNTATLKDAVTGDDIDGSAFSGSFNAAELRHVLNVVSPYEEDELTAIRKVQASDLNVEVGEPESQVLFLHPVHRPQALSSLNSLSAPLHPVLFDDGPYMDPPTDIVALDPSGTKGLITLTLASGAAEWLIGTTYAKGKLVHTIHDGTVSRYWVSLHDGNVGNHPGGVGGGVPMTDDWAILPVDWSAAVSYAIGEAVLDRNDFTSTTRVFYSLTSTNIGHRPTESPDNWSETAPTFDNSITYASFPVWVTFNGGLFVGKTSTASGGPPFPDPPDDTGWIDGLTPLAIFQLFPNINGGRGFLATDVDRCIRLQSGPEPWDAATSYSTNDFVNFEDNSYKALGSSTGVQPDLDPTKWEIQAVGPTWTWARIAYANQPVTEDIDEWVAGSYDTGDIVAWGLDADTTGKPTNAYVSLIDTNTATPPTDPDVLVSNGWLRVGAFVDFDVVPKVTVDAWVSGPTYNRGALVYVEGDTVLYAASENGLDSSFVPGTAPEWVTVNVVEATIIGTSTSIYALIEGDPLPNTDTIWMWRLGLYSDTTGWPRCGAYHEGRLWLAGPVKNRYDASMSNQPFVFSPTTSDGTVADDNAIARVLNFEDQNDIFWFVPQRNGIIMGTLAGEVLTSASSFDDPITPTSIQDRRITTYGCSDTEPVRMPSAVGVVQARKRKVLEYVPGNTADAYTGINLNQPSKDLTVGGVEDLAFQQERLPVLWARTADDTLFGVSYKRDAEQQYAAGHAHQHGAYETLSRGFTSIATQVDAAGTGENLWVITVDDNGLHTVEMLVDVFEEDAELSTARLLDSAVIPTGAQWIAGGADDGSIKFYGLWLHVGIGINSAVFFGFDVGDFTVQDDGTLSVPIVGDLTPELIVSLVTVASDTTSGPGSETVVDFTGAPFEDDLPPLDEGQHYEMAAIVGYTYDSDGQMLRQQEGGANGPPFAKTRRNARTGVYLWRTHEIKIGPNFEADLHPFSLREDDDATEIGPSALKTGVVRDTVEGSYDFDGQLCWRITRPMPGNVLAIGGFDDVVDV